MKIKWAVTAVALYFSAAGIAATVGYQHPDVSIVAVDESLDSVLKLLGKEMNLSVTTPIGINPVINCNIQNQPIKRAFKTLLGELSYSLVWDDDGERLTGLVILAGNGEEAGIRVSQNQSPDTGNTQIAYTPDASARSQSAAPVSARYNDPKMADREAEMAFERQEQEARMAEERAEQQARMKDRQQEEEIARETAMVEERAKRESEMADLAESLGLPPP